MPLSVPVPSQSVVALNLLGGQFAGALDVRHEMDRLTLAVRGEPQEVRVQHQLAPAHAPVRQHHRANPSRPTETNRRASDLH